MALETLPEWMTGLEEEDAVFLKKFVLASGSLKEVAGEYGVTYPTVRLRLDRVIQKIRMAEDVAADPFIATVKRLAINEQLDRAAAAGRRGHQRAAGPGHGQAAYCGV